MLTNKHNAQISVIVPIYNTEKYLQRCIASIQNQTYPDLEIILVNDGSVDKSGEICDKLAREDKRIHVIHQKNAGVSAARNTGLSVASGEYVGFIDSDDYVSPDMFGYMLGMAIKYDANVVQCGRVNVYNDEIKANHDESIIVVDSLYATKELMCSRQFRSSCCDKLYRKDVLQAQLFDKSLSTGEDFIFNYNVLKRAANVVISEKVCYFYYYRSDSCTKGEVHERFYNILDRLSDYERAEQNPAILPYWKVRRAMYAVNFLRRIILKKDNRRFKEFRKYVVAAKFMIFKPKEYAISKDKWFHVHILLVWLFPWLYKFLILFFDYLRAKNNAKVEKPNEPNC